MRFELVDSIVERSETSLTAVKNVSAAEEYLADHFPSFPVLPGVMMLEALVQAGRRLLEGRGERGGPWVLAEVRNLRYGNMVRPGQQLRVTVDLTGSEEACWMFKGGGTVEDRPAVQGRFVLRSLGEMSPPADGNDRDQSP